MVNELAEMASRQEAITDGFLEVTHIVIVPDLRGNITPESPSDRAIHEGSLVNCDNGRDICNFRRKDLEGHLPSTVRQAGVCERILCRIKSTPYM